MVGDDARPLLDGNQAAENRGSGLAYFGRAEGIANGNRATRNGKAGIAVRDQAAPILEANALTGNGEAGLAYHEEAAGLARGNDCGSLWVARKARPRLEANLALIAHE